MTSYWKVLTFVGQSATAGLAVAFLIVLSRPDLVNIGSRVTTPRSSYAGAVNASAPSVVSLRTARLGQRGGFVTGVVDQGLGSGVVVSQDGYLVTNWHVIRDADQVVVQLADGRVAEPRILGADPETDLALLKIDPFDGLPTIGEISLDAPEPSGGTEVFCIGFPLGRSVMQQGETVIASTFRGIVSRKVQAYLQVDAAIHPGASGGPVIDGGGTIVGVVTAIHPVDREGKASAIGYIIPIAEAGDLWPQD